jgi:hypothetical protein
MRPDPLDSIAASYAGILETNQRLAVLLAKMRATPPLGLRARDRSLRGTAFALVLTGLTAMVVGLLIWATWTAHQESAALIQALTAATRALEHRLR